MPYALDSRGRPLLLVSSMAVHAQNLSHDTCASLFVAQPGVIGDPLGAARVTVMGRVGPAGPDARPLYLEVHESAQSWIDFDDFSLIQMEISDIYFIGGFGVMGWVGAEEYAGARHDPLADAASRIIEHMNADHTNALLAIARAFAGLEADEVRMTAVDRLGFDLRLKIGDRVHGTRIPFLAEVTTAGESRTMLVEMARRAAAASPQELQS